MPHATLYQYQGFEVLDSVRADLNRLQMLWALARARHGDGGPWLFGSYSLADVFFAPVAARIAGYRLSVSADASSYVAQHLSDTAFREWRAEGLQVTHDPQPYALDLPATSWPS